MRFGGHESFPVREGWLPKTLSLLEEDNQLFVDDFACDRIGVGRNMAKSIHHWLHVMGLTEKSGRKDPLTISKVGAAIMKKDPFFLKLGTWWTLHINIASRGTDAVAWNWFFNRFRADRFDRTRCSSELIRMLTIEGQRLPSPNTLNRDIACLLSSYAIPVPPAEADPEEGLDCPLRSLGLVMHLRESDVYQINRGNKKIPSAIVGYAFSICSSGSTDENHITKALTQVYSSLDGPSKTLVLDPEPFMEVVQQAEEELGSEYFHLELSGGERTVRYLNLKPVKWLEMYYRGTSN